MWALLLTILFQELTETSSVDWPFDTFSTLQDHYTYVKRRMPFRDTQLFEYPNMTAVNDWEQVCLQMLQATSFEDCPTDIPQSLVDLGYEAGAFYDEEISEIYCILSTTQNFAAMKNASSPLGIFVTNPIVDNCMITTSAHPINDMYTGDQAMITFKASGAKAFATPGSHRHATNMSSVCQENYAIADGAHNIATGIQAAIKAIKTYYEMNPCEFTVIQFHAMSATSCEGDAYFTYGGNSFLPHADEKIDVLRDCIVNNQQKSFIATYPGEEPYCGLAGYTNTQARLLNGVPAEDVCGKRAEKHETTFIHYEQVRWLREPSQFSHLINGINCAIENIPNALPPAPPPTCNITSPVGGDEWTLGSVVNITWDISGIRNDTFKVSAATAVTHEYGGFIDDNVDAESGLHTFTVGRLMRTGNDRVIRLRYNKNPAVKCYSEPFSIVHQFSGLVAENDGALTIQRKKFVTITWEGRPDLCPKVKLSWHNNGYSRSYYRTIALETDNNGSYNYYMSSTFALGDSFSLRVRCTSGASVFYYSDMNKMENSSEQNSSEPVFYTIISH